MILLLTLLFFLLGTAIGSFLNVVAYRSTHDGTIFFDVSRCPHCQHNLAPKDLVPLLSFLLLRGRCRYCGKPISRQYPLVEASSGLLFAFVFLYWLELSNLSLSLETFINLIYFLFVVGVLLALVVTDLREGLLPNGIVLTAIVTVLLFKILFLLLGIISLSGLVLDLVSSLIVAGIFFLIVFLSNERAMGGGDIKLAFFMGLVLGWPLVLTGLFLACLTGGLVAAMLLLIGKKRFGQTLPFGPFLSLGTFLALFWGREIASFYLRFFTL